MPESGPARDERPSVGRQVLRGLCIVLLLFAGCAVLDILALSTLGGKASRRFEDTQRQTPKK